MPPERGGWIPICPSDYRDEAHAHPHVMTRADIDECVKFWVDATRRAFMAALADPELLEEARRREIAVRPIPAERVTAMIEAAFATPAPVVARYQSIYERLSR